MFGTLIKKYFSPQNNSIKQAQLFISLRHALSMILLSLNTICLILKYSKCMFAWCFLHESAWIQRVLDGIQTPVEKIAWGFQKCKSVVVGSKYSLRYSH